MFGCCVLLVLFVGFRRHLAFLFTYSPISGNSQSKTKRFYDRLSFERARHGLKKKKSQSQLIPVVDRQCLALVRQCRRKKKKRKKIVPRDNHSRNWSLSVFAVFCLLGADFSQTLFLKYLRVMTKLLFWIHTRLVPAKNDFQPRLFSSQPAFPAWSVIQEITFSMREGKPFWNGRAPGKGCFQPRAYSRPELFPALYSFQPHSDHP